MDLGSKEVLMESPPVSVIMCVCTCGCMHVVGPAASNLFPSSKFMCSIKLELCSVRAGTSTTKDRVLGGDRHGNQ